MLGECPRPPWRLSLPPLPVQVLRPGTLAALVGLSPAQHGGVSAGNPAAGPAAGEAGAMRVARHALRRCDAVLCLLHRLATIPEMVESARATGLTLEQARRRGARTWL